MEMIEILDKMNDLEIIENPTEEIIDKDLERSDLIAVIHTNRKIEIEELLDITKETPEYQIVYIHYYTKDNKYTIGVKKIESRNK